MCKIAIDDKYFSVKIEATKIYLPKQTIIGIINLTKNRCKANEAYYHEIFSSKKDFADSSGGVTISKTIWEQMVKDLDLTVIKLKFDYYKK